MNDENLIPTTELTESERRELGHKGGVASGEARRRKKRMREWAEVFGAKPIKVKNADGTMTDTDYDGAVVAGQYHKAIVEHSTKAAKLLAELRGELEQKVEVDVNERKTLDIGEIDKEALLQLLSDLQR